ncbi:MAG: class I SAM-dependent methyltransferase [Carboxydocellales bacterium]
MVFYNHKDYDYDLAALYGEGYFIGNEVSQGYNDYFLLEKSLTKTFETRLDNIHQRFASNYKNLLDVGCGPGFFLNVAKKQGWKVKGVEISEFAATFANENFGLEVITGTLEAGLFHPDSFGLVTLWDVLEHLPEPLDTLMEINKVLRPGGLLVLTTGDIGSFFAKICGSRWHLLNIPEHVFYFNQLSIQHILVKAGFKVLDIKYERSYYTLEYLFERLKKTLFPGIDRLTKIIPRDLIVPINLFDIMTVYAVKET